jgi:hypothetical protein
MSHGGGERKRTEKDGTGITQRRRGFAEKKQKEKAQHRVQGGGTEDTESRVYN